MTEPGYDLNSGLSGAKANAFYHFGMPRGELAPPPEAQAETLSCGSFSSERQANGVKRKDILFQVSAWSLTRDLLRSLQPNSLSSGLLHLFLFLCAVTFLDHLRRSSESNLCKCGK